MQREGQALPLSIVRPPLSSRQRRERADTPWRPLPPHPVLTPSARKGKRGEGNTARQSSPPTRRAARGEGGKSSPAPANSPSDPLCTTRQRQERGHDPQQPRPPPSLAPFTGRGKREKHRSAVGSYASSGGKGMGGTGPRHFRRSPPSAPAAGKGIHHAAASRPASRPDAVLWERVGGTAARQSVSPPPPAGR